MSSIGFNQVGYEKHAGPGRWNDTDMLVVGKVGWGRELRDSRLSPNEQVTHITLWSLQAAPLLIGADMSQIDEFTVDLLANPEGARRQPGRQRHPPDAPARRWADRRLGPSALGW